MDQGPNLQNYTKYNYKISQSLAKLHHVNLVLHNHCQIWQMHHQSCSADTNQISEWCINFKTQALKVHKILH